MPQLVAFNRRWTIASDDFVYPGFVEIVLRLVWVVAISIVFHLHKDAFECTGGNLLRAYYIGLLFLLSLSIVMTAVIVYTSMQGTMTNSWPRRRIPKLLYTKFAISLPELVWNILGTYWAFDGSSGCESHVVMTVKGAVISGWAIAVIVIIGIAVIFDPLGGLHDRSKSQSLESDETDQVVSSAANAAKKVWERRCKVLCCCVGFDEQSTDAFSGIAQLFSNFFQNVDLVPTDIACGLILVQREQERKNCQLISVVTEGGRPRHSSASYETFTPQPSQSEESPAIIPTSSSNATQLVATGSGEQETRQPQLQPGTPKPWMNTGEMRHYMKFAMASYGWPLYIFTHLMTGACQLWSQCKCCYCIGRPGDIRDDNCCRCNTAAIKKTTAIHQDDIVYASFHNKIYEIPFFVCIDREGGSVVVAIRGTLSLKDVITDLTAENETLDIEGLDNCVAHKGILQAAKYVKNTLERLQILEQAFDRAQGAKLVITGHSLGAGTAALLSILLRPKYPDLQCFAFSPPGELLSPRASEFSRDFTCAVVLGKDLVPRLGMHRMEELKTKLLRAIQDCDLPKFKLLASGVWQVFCGLPDANSQDPTSTRMNRPLIEDRPANGHTGNLETALNEAIRQSEQSRVTHSPLYPPGHIMHILEMETNKTCCGVPDYYAEWAQTESFSEILVSPQMVSDHFPDAVMRALDQLAEKDFTPKPRRRQSASHSVTVC